MKEHELDIEDEPLHPEQRREKMTKKWQDKYAKHKNLYDDAFEAFEDIKNYHFNATETVNKKEGKNI